MPAEVQRRGALLKEVKKRLYSVLCKKIYILWQSRECDALIRELGETLDDLPELDELVCAGLEEGGMVGECSV